MSLIIGPWALRCMWAMEWTLALA